MDPQFSSEDLSVLLVVISAAAAVAYNEPRYNPTPYHTSMLTGWQWVYELISGHPDRMKHVLGVRPNVFLRLCTDLCRIGCLSSSRHVDIEEQLAMFLYLGTTNLGLRQVAERFCRSISTISFYVHRVLNAVLSPTFTTSVLRLPTTGTPLSPIIADNPKFYPYFKLARGAIDGSHVGAFAGEGDRARHRDRDGNISQNILFACTFEMLFCYVLGGWEGSASDSFIYQQARQTTLRIPDGFYLLADAGFPSCNALLVPYRGVRYHLREWGAAGLRPQTYQELFNLRHSQLRNVIERCFGVMKRQFPIVGEVSEYDLMTQTQLVLGFTNVFNYNRIHDMESDDEEDEAGTNGLDDIECGLGGLGDPGVLGGQITAAEKSQADARRDTIAKEMWRDYQAELARRNEM